MDLRLDRGTQRAISGQVHSPRDRGLQRGQRADQAEVPFLLSHLGQIAKRDHVCGW